MASTALKRTLYDDLADLPPHLIGEILAGELVVSPRPAAPHARSGSTLLGELNVRFHRRVGGPGGPGGWWIVYEPELHLDEHVLVPDIAGWRRERMPRHPVTAAYTLAPDWVCEILSPGTARYDQAVKKPIYARAGVSWLWLVDPLAQYLEVMTLENGAWRDVAVFSGNEIIRARPFDEVELDMARWWEEE